MRTNEGGDVKMSNLPLTLVGISNVSTGGKLSQFDNGHLKQKSSEVVEKMSESCQKLLKNFPTVGTVATVRCVTLSNVHCKMIMLVAFTSELILLLSSIKELPLDNEVVLA